MTFTPLCAIILAGFWSPSSLTSQVIAEPIKPKVEIGKTYTEDEVRKIAIKYGNKWGVEPEKLVTLAFCESTFRNIQSTIVDEGKRENSHGLYQIHLDTQPTITKEQAYNVEFSADWAAEKISKGEIWRWKRCMIKYNL